MFRAVLFAFFVFMQFLKYSAAQHANASTDVVIIGLVHYGNKVYTADTLMRVVKRLKPDVLLDELDTLSYPYRKGGFRRMLAWRLLSTKSPFLPKMSLEGQVIHRYHRENPDVVVRSFDQAIANRRKYMRGMRVVDVKLFNAVYYAHINNEMSDHQNSLYDQFLQADRFLDRSINFPLWRMNNDTTTAMLRQRKLLGYAYFRKFVDSIPSLSRFSEVLAKDEKEWTERNHIMAQNILRYINQYPGKRIVVLTGNMHRYFLLDLLSPQKAKHNFRLLDLHGNDLKVPAMQQSTGSIQ